MNFGGEMQKNYRTFFGLVLILAGILLLAQRMGFIGGEWDDAILTLVFAIGTIYFANLFYSDRSRWWAALVSFIMLGIAVSQFIEIFLPSLPDFYVGVSLLMLMGIGFLAIYFIDKQMWWAIIPGGVMLSLSAVTAADELIPNGGFEAAGLLFLGLGLTFFVLYFLRVPGPRLSWAIYPALALLGFGLFIGFGEEDLWNIIWPSMIVLLGFYFIFGAFRRK